MKPPKGRNPVAYALALRGAGKTLKHRLMPRGGAKNTTEELLRMAAEEEYYEEDNETNLRAVPEDDQEQ